MTIYPVQRFPACPNCGHPLAVAREIAEVPTNVKELAKDNPMKECLRCGVAWYETSLITQEGQHKRIYHIIRHTDRSPWLENMETVTFVLPKTRKRRR